MPSPFDTVVIQQREEVNRKRLRAIRHAETLAKHIAINAGNRRLDGGPYSIIYADPPWQYRQAEVRGAAQNQYPTMDVDAICSLPVGAIAERDAMLALWATGPLLPEALRVMSAWGFEYKAQGIWRKNTVGTGFWFRGKHENVLIGTRGKFPCPPPSLRMASIFDAPNVRHSVKPTCIAEYLELSYPGLSKLEMFARQPREGWATWGNESA